MKNKYSKKLITVILSFILIVMSISCSLSAVAVTNGTAGDGVTFSFDESTGNIVFSGTGVISSDWQNSIADYENIKTATIENGITGIGKDVFRYCTSLKSVTIPNSLTSIKHGAFSYCDNLADMYFYGTQIESGAIEIEDIGDSNRVLDSVNLHCIDNSNNSNNSGSSDNGSINSGSSNNSSDNSKSNPAFSGASQSDSSDGLDTVTLVAIIVAVVAIGAVVILLITKKKN